MAEQTSCVKPGSVSAADRLPPPMVSSASKTVTSRPACASVIAAARPFGPEPTTMARALLRDVDAISGRVRMFVRLLRDGAVAAPEHDHPAPEFHGRSVRVSNLASIESNTFIVLSE